jgi:hypothetical protein
MTIKAVYMSLRAYKLPIMDGRQDRGFPESYKILELEDLII